MQYKPTFQTKKQSIQYKYYKNQKDFYIYNHHIYGAILKKWTAKSERWYNNKKGEKDMENTKYTEEFKQSIVSLYESGKSSTQICKEYGMSSSTLHKWIKKYTKVQVSETEIMTMAEIKKMQKKLALLEEENIILKKAMAIFSRESGKE